MDAVLQETRKQLEEQKQKNLAIEQQKLQVERELDQRIEQLISQAQAAQAARERAEIELNEKTNRCDFLAKESAAKEQTLVLQIEELRKESQDKTGLLEKERRQRSESDADHKETSQKLDAELQARKTQLDKLANLLEKARNDLEKEQKDRQNLLEAGRRKEKELQASLDSKASDADRLKQDLEKEKASHAETAKKSKEKLTGLEKKLQTALEEKNKIIAQTEQSLQNERKEHAASIRSIRMTEEELQRDLDEKTGLLERTRRELEKEKTLRADSETKRKEAEGSAESEMRNLKAQSAGLAKLLEAAKLELNKEREEHEAFVKVSCETEKALRDEIHGGSGQHIANLEAEIANLKAKADESARLAEQTRKDMSATQDGFAREKEAFLKQIQELEGRRNHAEILVQETILELNKHKDKHRAFAQEAQTRQQSTRETHQGTGAAETGRKMVSQNAGRLGVRSS